MDFMQEYEKWFHSPALSPEEHAELESIKDDPKEIESRFFGPLEFGTAGLRGTMYTGLHNMNIHVIRWATQGFADVIAAEGEEGKRRGVAICMDCRNHSMEFARAAAEVCAANGIHVRIFDSLRPTPELSFAVREYGCQAGINVTASHNPKEYNGYKVYWSDGAQLPPHHADAIAKRLEEIDIFDGVKRMDFEEAVKSGLIETMGDETDRKFMANVTAMINDRETVAKVADTFKLVYTPFHGCGYKLVPEALTALGIKHLIPVPEQMVIDGNFPTVVSPNPENPEGFYLAIDLAKKNDVDFILGTDPDSDRVGIMVRNHEGEFQPVTGNQTGVLLLDYLIGAMKRSGKMPANPVALKTIVTTEMARKVAESNGVKCFDTFTGFKFMAEKKNALEESGEGKVIFSYEESYGYMLGDYVRDKDAVTASMLLTEMAAWYDAQGMTLFDALNALYEKYGWYAEKTHNLVMPGLDGLRDMAKLMKDLRENPPTEISGVKVIVRKDYTDGSVIDCVTGAKSRMELSGSNVLRYELEDGTVILVGATTENPSFELNAALLSRCQVFVLNRLNSDDFEELLRRAEKETGRRLPVDDEARELMKATADGDGRYILNLAESVLNYAKEGEVFDRESLLKIIRSRAPVYDKGRDGHYNLISAVHKSLRGSDVDAALYWAARMVAAGEDPKYIFRRLTRFAVEDVSMADPNAVTQAIACWDTYERLGSPEGDLALMQLTVYLATAPKSAGVYKAMHKAFDLAKKTGSLMPPKHILNAPTKLMKELGYNRGYVYDQDLEDGFSGQNYFPDGISRQKLYFPVERGFEREVKKRVEYFDKLRREKNKNKQQEEDGQ